MWRIRIYHVYMITNNTTGKKYIGRASIINSKYWGSGKLIKQAIAKYGVDNFSKTILKFCDSVEDSKECEKYLIKSYNSITPNGYNISTGGDNNDWWEDYPYKEQFKQKAREHSLRLWSNPDKIKQREESRKRRFLEDDDYRERCLNAIKNAHNKALSFESNEKRKMWWTQERREAKSKRSKEYWNDPEKRIKRSIETKRRWKDPEYRKRISKEKKLSQAQREKWSLERRGGKNNKARPVICTEVKTQKIIEVECVRYVSKALGIHNYKVMRALKSGEEMEGYIIKYKYEK